MARECGEAIETVQFDILTLFPGMFVGPFEESILKRAREAGLLHIAVHNIRSPMGAVTMFLRNMLDGLGALGHRPGNRPR